MKNIKQIGLTLALFISASSFAQEQKSEVVMTQEELTSFLEKVAEARKAQLDARGNSSTKVIRVKSNAQTAQKGGGHGDDYVTRQLERINDRIDNLFMMNSFRGGKSNTLVTPGQSSQYLQGQNTPMQCCAENVTEVDTTKTTIAELESQLEALKSQLNSETPVIKDDSDDLQSRIDNAKTTEERRSALEELLAKYKNFKKQVFFANNSEQLNAEDFQYIKDVTEVLKKNEELSVVLEGWASPRGKADYNKQLSMRRAESVAKALRDNGIQAERIVSSFKGEDHSSSEAMARRVDMSVILK